MEGLKDYTWLMGDPEATADNGAGALHIPIVILENELDWLNWSTRNFQWSMYKDGYASLSVAASIELCFEVEDSNGKLHQRVLVGACNFPLAAIAPIQDWLATAKSMCIKNGASDVGKRFGRGINDEILPDRSTQLEKVVGKSRPDSKIMQQFMKAIEEKDEATITMLTNIYDIKTDLS